MQSITRLPLLEIRQKLIPPRTIAPGDDAQRNSVAHPSKEAGLRRRLRKRGLAQPRLERVTADGQPISLYRADADDPSLKPSPPAVPVRPKTATRPRLEPTTRPRTGPIAAFLGPPGAKRPPLGKTARGGQGVVRASGR